MSCLRPNRKYIVKGEERTRLKGIVTSEVKTSVDNDTNNGGNESSVKTGNTIGSKGLLVDVNETVELSGSTLGSGLVVVGKSGSGVVKGVDEKEGGSSGSSTGSQV